MAEPTTYEHYERNITDWDQLEFGTRHMISVEQADDITRKLSDNIAEIFEGTLNDTMFFEIDDFYIQLGYRFASTHHNDLFLKRLPKDQAWQLMDMYRTLEDETE